MRTAPGTVAAACALVPLAAGQTSSSTSNGTYNATWASTDQHNPAPEWFQDAKFGIYWHWGAFTTPQYYSEWYPRLMYDTGTDANKHHIATYGQPSDWGYEDFILGRDDLAGAFTQFKPVLASEGGQFDPVAWVKMVANAGAKFAGPVTEHHDGFSMWPSQVNEWNSFDKGPKLDLLGIFAEQIRANNMKVLTAHHTAYHFNGYYQYVPAQTNSSLQKLFAQLGTAAENELWLNKLIEAIDHIQPDIVWHDFDLSKVEEAQRLKFLAYYFNAGESWGKEVVTTFKISDSGFRTTSAVGDYERGGPASIVTPYWLTDDSVGANTWCYTTGIRMYNSTQMIHSLIDRVSKNGNMLLNISPMAVGTIPQVQQQILSDIGAYLSRYGEAVYSTRVWDVYGEGPTKAGGGQFTAPIVGTSKDLRFTRTKQSDILYVTILGWPSNSLVSITSLRSGVNLSSLTLVQLLGNTAGTYVTVTSWKQNTNSLDITLPAQPAVSSAYVLKLTFSGTIPKAAA